MTDLPEALVLYRNFSAPKTLTTNQLRDTFDRVWRKLRRTHQSDSDLVPEELTQATETVFRDELWDALRQQVYDMLDATYGDWIDDADSLHRVCACLHLPSVPSDLFTDWAQARGLTSWDESTGQTRVITTLDGRANRSAEGLRTIRAMCQDIENFGGKVLIFGSTIQWRFLEKVCDIDLITSDTRQLPPFDAMHLAALIRAHAIPKELKSRASGTCITKVKKDKLADTYLVDLAARTLGCPWAAIGILSQSITHDADSDPQDEVWVAKPDYPEIETRHRRSALFALHALLIHGPLSRGDLESVHPEELPIGLLRSLQRIGLLNCEDGLFSIARTNVPHIRRILSEAGFPLDQV